MGKTKEKDNNHHRKEMKIKELLATEDKWCKYVFSKDIKGNEVLNPESPKAVQWCILGAIGKCYHLGTPELKTILDKVENALGTREIGKWNNAPERTHKEVLDLVTKLDI